MNKVIFILGGGMKSLAVLLFWTVSIVVYSQDIAKPEPKQKLSREEIIQQDIKSALERLGSEWATQTDQARQELLEFGKKSVPVLIEALGNYKASVRFNACEMLGELREQGAIYAISRLLDDPDEYGISIAACAARSLGKIGDESAIPILMKSLESEKAKLDVELRYEAINALGVLRAVEGKDLVKKFLDDKATTYITKRMVMFAAVDTLGKLRANEYVNDIARLLDDKTTKEEWSGDTAELRSAKILERLTGQNFGLLLDADDEKTKETLKKWHEWWDARKKREEDEKKLKEAVESTRNKIKEVIKALELFKANEGRYPEKLADLVTKPAYAQKWPEGGYFKELPKDGWQKEFILKIPGRDGQPFEIVSYGADGKEGGVGADEDISSYEKPPQEKK
jgi:general secretion pathway protein G